MEVLKLFENDYCADDYCADAYYDIKYRRNVHSNKPINLPQDSDVELLLRSCNELFQSISSFEHPSVIFVPLRAACVTFLIIFNAQRGGEPVRLQFYQWNEALNGHWVEKGDLPEDHDETVLITYQTGKGSDHLVPIIFPSNIIQPLKFLTDMNVRKEAGVNDKNQ